MTDNARRRSPEEISGVMRSVRSQDTTPEMRFRKALRERGVRYRLHAGDLPGKPDIVFRSAKLAVFIDGDFWHGNQWSNRKLAALEDQFLKSDSKRKSYWLKKIGSNMNRDFSNTATLLADGWTVLRFWESQVKRDPDRCVEITMEALSGRPAPTRFALLARRTVAEFFAGIGLVRMALEKTGWTVAYANDLDPQKRDMYAGHFSDKDHCLHLADIHGVSAEQIPSVSLATASFPCNDLSLAGARKGLEGGRSSAFWGFVDLMDRMGERRPPLILLENVTGFLTSHKGQDLRRALLALNGLGYTVDAFILDAARFVPQSRSRLFVAAILDDGANHVESYDPLAVEADVVRPRKLLDFMARNDDVRWKARRLPEPPVRQMELEDVLEDLPEDSPLWWDGARAAYLLGQMSPRHRAIADAMIDRPSFSYGTVFRRVRKGVSMAELRTDGVAGCLRTPRGGSGRQILFKAGQGRYRARLVTPTECARLMGAGDYVITAPLNKALFGFGDAVCVPVIEWISKYYFNPLINELIRGRVLWFPS